MVRRLNRMADNRASNSTTQELKIGFIGDWDVNFGGDDLYLTQDKERYEYALV